jgi:hypothetical protein
METYGEYMVIPKTDAKALSVRKQDRCRVNYCQQPADWCKDHARSSKDRVPLHEAEKVMDWIRAKWPESEGWSHEYLFMTSYEHEELAVGQWAIAWEEGPNSWTYGAEAGEARDVFVEAYNSWLLIVTSLR